MSRERLLLGVDLGTSYFKLGLFNANGVLRGLGRVRVEPEAPTDGQRELPIAVFWRLLREGMQLALVEANATTDDIAAIAYSSQANTFLLLEGERPLTSLILWTDERGMMMSPAAVEFSNSDEFAHTVGFKGINPQMAVAKWRWFQRQRPEIWRRTTRVMTIADYFTFALTGERVGDASTAAFLGLYDLIDCKWWPTALDRFEMDSGLLSKPLAPGTLVGATVTSARELLGLPVHLPVAVGALDHYAAAIGSGIERLADVSISTGTVLAALTIARKVEPEDGCFYGPCVSGKQYYRLAFDMHGAGQLDAYQRSQRPDLTMDKLLALARQVHGGAIAASADGRAVREILDQIASRHRALVTRIALAPVQKIVATGGGARSPLLLQISANTIGAPVITTACAERACLGAAMFAAVAAGWHASIAEAAAVMVQVDRTYLPE